MKRLLHIFLLCASLYLVGCYKNEISYTYHPENGLVELVVSLSDQAEDGVVVPTSYTLEVNGVRSDVDDVQSAFLSLVEPGTYDIRVYNESDEIKIDSDAVAQTECYSDIYTKLSTEHVYFGSTVLEVSADNNYLSQIVVEPITATLTFEMLISDGDIDEVDNIYMTLSGVASGWDCLNGESVGEAKSVESSFEIEQTTRSTSRAETTTVDYLKSSLILLGVVGEEQSLNVVVTYKNGHKQVITSDLGGEFDDFNDNKTTSKIMQSTTSLLSETEYSATIVDWKAAEDSFAFEIGPGEALK